MPGKTAAPHELPYALLGDPADAEVATKPLADRVHSRLDAIGLSQLVVPGSSDGKLVIVKDGAAAYKAMSGDGTIDEDGNFQLGGEVVDTAEMADKAVTGAKVDDETIQLAKLAKALGLTEGYYADASVTSRKAKLTVGTKTASTDLTLTAGFQDIAGLKLDITPAVASRLLVVATFDVSMEPTVGESADFEGVLALNGETSDSRACLSIGKGAVRLDRFTAVQVYNLTLSAGAHTIEGRARKTSGKVIVGEEHTRFLYALVAA